MAQMFRCYRKNAPLLVILLFSEKRALKSTVFRQNYYVVFVKMCAIITLLVVIVNRDILRLKNAIFWPNFSESVVLVKCYIVMSWKAPFSAKRSEFTYFFRENRHRSPLFRHVSTWGGYLNIVISDHIVVLVILQCSLVHFIYNKVACLWVIFL